MLADVGFPSVCCEYVLLALVNKEATSAYGRAKKISGRKFEQRYIKRIGRVKEAQEARGSSKPQPRGDTQINRNGLI